MPWQFQPIMPHLLIATLALMAIPPARAEQPSPAIRAACENDVKRLCPKEYKTGDTALICGCMQRRILSISKKCIAAWIAEHGVMPSKCE